MARSFSVTTEVKEAMNNSQNGLSSFDKTMITVASKQNSSQHSSCGINPMQNKIKIKTILSQQKLEKIIGPIKYDKDGDPILSDYELVLL